MMILGYILTGLGVSVVLLATLLAFSAYLGFTGVEISGNLDSVLSGSATELINLAIRLGFLGIMIWGGSVLLNYGVKMVRGEDTHAVVKTHS